MNDTEPEPEIENANHVPQSRFDAMWQEIAEAIDAEIATVPKELRP